LSLAWHRICPTCVEFSLCKRQIRPKLRNDSELINRALQLEAHATTSRCAPTLPLESPITFDVRRPAVHRERRDEFAKSSEMTPNVSRATRGATREFRISRTTKGRRLRLAFDRLRLAPGGPQPSMTTPRLFRFAPFAVRVGGRRWRHVSHASAGAAGADDVAEMNRFHPCFGAIIVMRVKTRVSSLRRTVQKTAPPLPGSVEVHASLSRGEPCWLESD
jgi:hypothetical protein